MESDLDAIFEAVVHGKVAGCMLSYLVIFLLQYPNTIY